MTTAQSYLQHHFARAQGWLLENAVRTTEALIVSQRELGIPGATVEIGVWMGKYLGALIHLSPERRAYGIDVWSHDQADRVQRFLQEVAPDTPCRLRRANTYDVDTSGLRDLIEGDRIAFASVDGSHQAAPVEHDLLNVARLLSPGGIIAIDDFLNPMTLGVLEGTFAFLRGGAAVEPICYAANKLFVTTTGWAELYQVRLRMWLEAPAASVVLGTDRPDWAANTTYLLGRPVLNI